jgi:hypothetical protein
MKGVRTLAALPTRSVASGLIGLERGIVEGLFDRTLDRHIRHGDHAEQGSLWFLGKNRDYSSYICFSRIIIMFASTVYAADHASIISGVAASPRTVLIAFNKCKPTIG